MMATRIMRDSSSVTSYRYDLLVLSPDADTEVLRSTFPVSVGDRERPQSSLLPRKREREILLQRNGTSAVNERANNRWAR